VDLGEKATCFYSVHMPRHEYKRMTEIDFLIVLKGLVLVIEVKGGRVARREGLWTFTDRYGDTNEKREGPFDQARTGMFALETALRQRVHGLTSGFGSVVITPDQAFDPDIEWESVEHIGPAAMTVAGLTAGLSAAVRHYRRRAAIGAGELEYQEILSVIRPDFDRVPRLSQLANTFEADYVALASEQYDMLRGSEINPRILCMGGAGSGKTLLAVETARRAAAQGARVLLTCRSGAVIDLMRRSLDESAVTCASWDETRGQAPFDVVVVDEAQDLMTVDDCLLLDQLVDGGLAQGRWRVFSDPNNQANVDGDFDVSIHDELKSHAALYQLPYNCRNTSSIVQQTQLMTGADLGLAKAGQGPAVEYERPATDADTVALMDARLKRLRQQEIELSDIVVITLRENIELSSAINSKSYLRRDLVPHDPLQGNESRAVGRLATVQQFKGLEAPHVLVIDIDDVSTSPAMSRLYVAMTRPRISLWLAVGPGAWEQLTQTPEGNRS
jgi:hypothetical protein